LLAFVFIGPYFLVSGMIGVLIGILSVMGRASLPTVMQITQRVSSAFEGVLMVSVALLVMGRMGRVLLRRAFQMPKLVNFLIAVLLPVVASCAIPMGQYITDRVQWAAHFYGKLSPPQLSVYFNPSNAWQPWLLLMFFAALAEEMIFRGMMLPSFINRYGLHRGVFLTGITWAAIHFRADTYSRHSVGGVLLQLVNRIILCLILNYLFSWLTLRQGSIIPATIAHTIWNICAVVLDRFDNSWEVTFRIGLAGVIAYVLFRFWPIRDGREAESLSPDTAPEPAV